MRVRFGDQVEPLLFMPLDAAAVELYKRIKLNNPANLLPLSREDK